MAAVAEPFFAAWSGEDGTVTVRIDPDQIESPGHAGIMLADWMRHLARAFHQTGKATGELEALAEMVALLEAELNNPTDDIEGSVET